MYTVYINVIIIDHEVYYYTQMSKILENVMMVLLDTFDDDCDDCDDSDGCCDLYLCEDHLNGDSIAQD